MTKVHPTREMICRVMADGRERTAGDIGAQIGKSAESVAASIKPLMKMGLIEHRAFIHGYAIYRATSGPEQEAGA